MDLTALQASMRQSGIDAWLLYDFRGNNPTLWRLLGERKWTTRRVFALVRAEGDPILLAHRIDASQLTGAPLRMETYLTWQDLRGWLAAKVGALGGGRVAMEYSPGGTLPVVSIADAGTIEAVRACGVEVVSSANLIQVFASRWSPAALAAHERASAETGRIKDEAFALIRERTAAGGTVKEREVQEFILNGFKAAGLETAEAPIVAANAHSGDPHFEVSATESATIGRGDWVLIDLWARFPGEDNIFADITWVGYVGEKPTSRHSEVFETVRAARDASLKLAQDRWARGVRVQGWELDDAARNVIVGAGFSEAVRHRTGHSLSPGALVHGSGMNLDNLETHDTREMIPGTGFTIEPGIYLPEFGVRLEINVYVDPAKGPTVTSGLQSRIILM